MIAIVDIDSVCYSAFAPNKVLDEFGIPLKESNKFVYIDKTEEEIIQSVDSCMHYILSNSEATGYIGYIKGDKKDNYRYFIDENYKANRSKEQPKHWELVKRLFIDTWKVIEVNGVEVDDYVNIAYRNIDSSFICAIDKDLLGLESIEGRPHYNWRKKEWITVSKEEAEFRFWRSMITGDTIDGIKGLVGKGKVFAEKLLVGDCKEFDAKVLESYLDVHKLTACGEKEYNKNYGLLKILDLHESFNIPEVVYYEKPQFNIDDLV